ncbi:DUF4913 domain-containing protein [Pseudokineococcus sp. 5B2Z-1]|uniref:DUF4913 domain-containing protein n=1 Tax=Pseudokineococcus sp. 5B2Z-1 TaxID=3132744 RepID=UPI0030A64280
MSSPGAWDDEDEPVASVHELHQRRDELTLPALRAGMDAAVQRAVQKRLEDVATAAVDEAFDDDVMADLADVARSGAVEVVSPDQPPALFYATLPDFVEGFLATTYARSFDLRELTWCPQWWRHSEAVVRLDAIWRAWEHLRKDPTVGTSTWLLQHGDPNMNVLMSADGPLKGCSPDKGHREPPWRRLPLEKPPPGLYDAGDDA